MIGVGVGIEAGGPVGRGGAVAETVTGAGYRLVWRDGFESLSLRTGGPTPAGYAAGRGTWADVGFWYAQGVGDYAKGFPDAGYTFAVRHGYDWQAIDPAFPPLGMLDITEDGLVLLATSDYPLIRAAVPPATAAADGVERITAPPAVDGAWFDNGATGWTGSVADGLPAPRVVASAGAAWHRREFFAAGALEAGARCRVVVRFNLGTSGRGAGIVGNDAGDRVDFWVDAGGLVAARAVGGATVAGAQVAAAGGDVELSFEMSVSSAGALIFGIGPDSAVAGETLVLHEVSVVTDGVASQPRFLGSVVSSLYSAKIRPPFYRETVLTLDDDDEAWPAAWGLGNRAAITDPAQEFGDDDEAPQFEVDDLERFGNQDAVSATSIAIHADADGGYRSMGAVVDVGTPVVGAPITIGVQVTLEAVRFFFDGALIGTFDVPPGSRTDQLMHSVFDNAIGRSWAPYPAGYSGTARMVVRSISYYAPPGNATGRFPPAPPVPVVAWAPGFEGGLIPRSTPAGTGVATLGGAATFAVLGSGCLTAAGSELRISGALTGGDLAFYVEGTDPGGIPGIAPRITARVV